MHVCVHAHKYVCRCMWICKYFVGRSLKCSIKLDFILLPPHYRDHEDFLHTLSGRSQLIVCEWINLKRHTHARTHVHRIGHTHFCTYIAYEFIRIERTYICTYEYLLVHWYMLVNTGTVFFLRLTVADITIQKIV